MTISFALGFLLGVLAILAGEAFFLYWIIGWLVRRSSAAAEAPPITSDRDSVERPLTFPVSKQVVVGISHVSGPIVRRSGVDKGRGKKLTASPRIVGGAEEVLRKRLRFQPSSTEASGTEDSDGYVWPCELRERDDTANNAFLSAEEPLIWKNNVPASVASSPSLSLLGRYSASVPLPCISKPKSSGKLTQVRELLKEQDGEIGFLLEEIKVHVRNRDVLAGEIQYLKNAEEGTVWVLQPEKVPKRGSDESPTRGPKELKQKKGIIEVYPVKKYAKIKDRSLSLSDVDGSQAVIQLLDCQVLAVSASDLSTRKWAKRYPIKLESKNSIIYNGSKTCYIYFGTSWEKESWCKALRLASSSDREKLNWFALLTEEFHQYLVSLSAEGPSFLKPPTLLFDEATDKSSRVDGSSSRVQSFLRKLTKKATKNAIDSRTTSISASTRDERKNYVKTRPLLDVLSTDESVRSSVENLSSSPTSGKNLLPVIPDSVVGEKIVNGEGTLCWNLLFSRLFFDASRSTWLTDVIKTRIQKALSNMRTPSYIGGVTCTGLNLGNLPPFIHKIRVLPVDLNEEWTVEVDIDYPGGIMLDFKTRIEVCEPELEKDIMDTSHAPTSVEGMTSDLLKGIEDYGSLLRSSSTSNLMKNRDEVDKVDALKVKSTKWTSSYASRWKAALQSIIANQVSQVPISLAVQITSLRGTLCIHIKPPPSDQIWFGFTSMPEIEWNLDSSIGERKIVSSHVALILGNRLKASIRDILVVPNYESITVPWMSAEKDDWVPVKVAPFMWNNQEATDTTGLESTISPPEEGKAKLDGSSRDKVEEIRNGLPEQSLSGSNASQSNSLALFSTNRSLERSTSEELREPLIRREKTEERQEQSEVEFPQISSLSSLPREILMLEQQDSMHLEDGVKPKRMGSRRKMFDIGKKVGERLGEKFEEQKRHFGERSRSLVEKMREKQHRDP